MSGVLGPVTGAAKGKLVPGQEPTHDARPPAGHARNPRVISVRSTGPLVHQIDALTGTDFTTITLNRPGRYNRPRVHESHPRLSNYPEPVRQLIITGLGRDAPTVIITKTTTSPPRP